MTQTEQIVLGLVGRALFATPYRLLVGADMAAVLKEANAQKVLPLLYASLDEEEKKAIPADMTAKLKIMLFSTVAANERLLHEQARVIALLEAKNIPYAILKGSSAAAYYPDPTLRSMGDIDILVLPEQQKETIALLQTDGYGEVLEENHHCHLTVVKNGISVEVHKEPNGFFSNRDKRIEQRLRALFSTAIAERAQTGTFAVLSDTHQAVVLILHKLEHFLSGGLGLRQLCDWAVFVKHRLNEALWAELSPLLADLGLLTFTKIITRVCVDYLSLPLASAPFAADAPELSAEVMERIMAEGNFGSKEREAQGQHFFADVQSGSRIASFFHVFAAACRRRWPPCERHPILMVVAPFVMVVYYFKSRLTGKRERIRPILLYRQAKRKRKLYSELKAFVISEENQ